MKNDNMNDKCSIRIFGKKISSHNFFALILCTIIGVFMICTTLYRNKKLDQSEKPVAFLSDYAHNLDSLNRKNGISETPLN